MNNKDDDVKTSSEKRKRALYVSAFIPQQNALHAGGRVAFENVQNLIARFDAVDVVVCTTEAGVPKGTIGDSFIVIRQNLRSLMAYLLTKFFSLSWQEILTAPIIHTRLNLAAERCISGLLVKHEYEEIHVDFTQVMNLVVRSKMTAHRNIPIALYIHDVFFQRIYRSAKLLEKLVGIWVANAEGQLLSNAKFVTVLNNKDKLLIETMYLHKSVKIKAFVPPLWSSRVLRAASPGKEKILIFFGNFHRRENAGAVDWFMENAWAKIKKEIPEATLQLIGTGSDTLANRYKSFSGVMGTGFVLDPSKYFSECACCIAPLSEGAGVKFKVLEALACGVPVIGTPVAAEGIDADPKLIQSDLDGFSDCVVGFLRKLPMN